MNKRVGIWIDTKQAFIIFIKERGHVIKVVRSYIEGRERIPGEKKQFARFGIQFSNFEKKKENRKIHDVQNYLAKVVHEIRDTDEIVLFGPGEMKTELEKFMLNKSLEAPIIRRVETTDSMTQNQMVALTKDLFHQIS